MQVELNKKREAELARLKKELDDAHVKTEQMTSQLKKKSQDALSELTEQLEQITKAKSQYCWLHNFHKRVRPDGAVC